MLDDSTGCARPAELYAWQARSLTSIHVGAVLDVADEQYPVVFADPERDAVVAAACNAPA
jgi:hypothetical protein